MRNDANPHPNPPRKGEGEKSKKYSRRSLTPLSPPPCGEGRGGGCLRHPAASHSYTKEDTQTARRLRHESSPAERKFWRILRPYSKTLGLYFRRQFPIPPYFADFVCLSANLVVELDGTSHDASLSKDAVRDTFLSAQGFHVLHFANDEVYKNAEGVAETVCNIALKRSRLNPHPNPPRKGEGEEFSHA